MVIEIYKISKNFPKDELFGIINQMRRCAVSITSNIAEGFSRNTYKEKIRFYSIALGSLTELQNQILIVKDIDYIDGEIFRLLANKTVILNKIINGLIKKSKTFPS